MIRYVVMATVLACSFVCQAETDEELLMSHLSLSDGTVQQRIADDSKAPEAWTLAMQERWGMTTPLRELAFYQQIQAESAQEVREVYQRQLHAPSKINVSQNIAAIVKKYAEKYNISEALVIALIQTESRFDIRAISPKGAKGLMQLMDAHSRKHGIDPYNPEENIQVGTQLLARLLYKYDDIRLALAAYNAGEGAVNKYNGVPPYKETREYVSKVMNLLGE